MSTHETRLPLFDGMVNGPAKRYRTLVADPPWGYRDKLGGPQERGAEGHYPTMSMDHLYQLPVGLWATDDAHLYLWTTNAFMEEAHRLARAWGFTTRTILTWVKGRIERERLIQQIGMGHFYRNSQEHVLFCVRGTLSTKRNDMPTVFLAPRGEHSEKPAAFYDIVAQMSHPSYLDVFARRQRWIGDTCFEVMDAFGNEVFNARGLLDTLSPEQADGLVEA